MSRCLQSVTRAVQINLKQRINSTLNNKQMIISSNVFTRTSLSATVTQVSNFVEENVLLILHRQDSRSWCIQSLIACVNALSMFKALFSVKMRSSTLYHIEGWLKSLKF